LIDLSVQMIWERPDGWTPQGICPAISTYFSREGRRLYHDD